MVLKSLLTKTTPLVSAKKKIIEQTKNKRNEKTVDQQSNSFGRVHISISENTK